MAMTEKQKRFCDEYVISLNATQAYLKAYPNCKKKSSADASARKLLEKARIQEYIKKRMDEKEDELIASQDEVLETLTRILRREEKETVVVTCKERKSYYDNKGKKVTEEKESPVLVEIPTKISDVNRAAELLGKRYALYTDKLDQQADVELNVKIDYGDQL